MRPHAPLAGTRRVAAQGMRLTAALRGLRRVAAQGMRLTALVLLVAALGLGACEGLLPHRLSMENYQKVTKDMTYEEVVKILGAPADTKSLGVGPLSATAATWENEQAKIDIKFLNQKVQLKNYVSKEPKKSQSPG